MKYIPYKSKENSKPTNLLLAIVFGSVLAFFFGWFYSIISLIPIIYFKILITVGFAFAIAYTVLFLAKIIYIKDKKTMLILTFIIALVTYYSQWISFIIYIYDDGLPTLNNYFNYWIAPNNFFSIVSEINKNGTWEINALTVINGFSLTIVWLIEAIIILLVSVLFIYKQHEKPFSEKLNKWYPKFVIDEEFEPIYSSSRFILNIKEKGIEHILNLKTGFALKHSKITMYFLEGEDIQYLAIDNVYIKLIKGESKTTITSVIEPFEITTIDTRKIFKKFKVLKSSHFDFL